MQNQTISELYIDDKKSKYSSNPKDILKSTKKFFFKSAINELLNKISNYKNISTEHFNLCDAEISLDKIKEAIQSQKNNKSLGNDGLTAEFYKIS